MPDHSYSMLYASERLFVCLNDAFRVKKFEENLFAIYHSHAWTPLPKSEHGSIEMILRGDVKGVTETLCEGQNYLISGLLALAGSADQF